ncbi:uncharacterized protein LOC129602704 [Paramacrobiotus metropolitanus]|uniref:uncharacterized protein LOC129602704 n=1 Tax=Paramacrobiotus metropolitanus TaxID=2943436 RepID=UPI0024459EA4|nr:uncharacterized protein LOC129602704 [Paramacrobiotus metropolitanus]
MVSPRSKSHQSASGAPGRAFQSEDSCDSQNTPSSCSSDCANKERTNDSAKMNSTSYTCLWHECNFLADEPDVFFNHLQNHVQANLKGPCRWDTCSVSNNRQTRHESRFMEHHIKTHMPKKQFRCLINPCNKAFDTPDELTNHMFNHPKPKKNDRPDYKLDDPLAGQFRSSLIASLGTAAEQQRRNRTLELQQYLREMGIIYTAHLNEYYVKVHLVPVKTSEGPRYKVHFPFAPAWIKDITIECALETEGTETIVYELALSNSIFKEQLRWFVKKIQATMESGNANVI